jgi:hypothetical protein
LHRTPRRGETSPLTERLRVADNPQETLRELRDLVIAYVKQETVEPIKGLGRYAGFGILGAFLIGMGIMFVEIGVLRILQGTGGQPHFTGNWSWAPYGIVVVLSLATAAIAWYIGGKRKRARAARGGSTAGQRA